MKYRGQVKVIDWDHPLAMLFSDDAYWIDGAISHVDLYCQRTKHSMLVPTSSVTSPKLTLSAIVITFGLTPTPLSEPKQIIDPLRASLLITLGLAYLRRNTTKIRKLEESSSILLCIPTRQTAGDLTQEF